MGNRASWIARFMSFVAVCGWANLSDTFYVQVDHRILKAIAIEHRKDVDAAVVAVLDEVMPSMTSSAASLSVHDEVLPSMADSGRNLFANHSTHEVGSSSSAGESEYQSFVNLYLVLKVFPCFFSSFSRHILYLFCKIDVLTM